MAEAQIMNAIIMAGGSGTRFWPASREALPKQFLRITGERTMLEETIARIEPIISPDRVAVIVGRIHEAVTRTILKETPTAVLVEPAGRNTAACIGLAALYWRERAPGQPLVVLPADHYIANRAVFNSILTAAAGLARDGAIVTLGIEPTRPETGYGYIRVGERTVLTDPTGGWKGLEVEAFVEKPDLETALGYLRSGNYLWNSGIFLFTPETILAEIEAHLPELAAGLAEIERAPAGDATVLDRVYGELPSISIDHGIIEKTRRPLYVIRSEFGWSDVGSWQALYELRPEATDAHGNLIQGAVEGRVWIEDSHRNLVYSTTGRRVALLGVEGLAIVDTADTLMVADTTRSQDVKRFAMREKNPG